MDNEKEGEGTKVSIMTLHGSKGLEFPQVFLPGWEDGLFPSQRSMDESGVTGLEEERRLAYVGITRAEEVCTISFAANRRVFGLWQSALPSRFIDELPEEHVDVMTPPGLYGGGFGAAAPKNEPQSTFHEKVVNADVYNSPGWRRLQSRSQNRPAQQAPKQKSLPFLVGITQSNISIPKAIFSNILIGVPTPIRYLGLSFGRISVTTAVISYISSAGSPTESPPIAFPSAPTDAIYSADCFLKSL